MKVWVAPQIQPLKYLGAMTDFQAYDMDDQGFPDTHEYVYW